MADVIVPLAEKRMRDVKLAELVSWLGTRDFTPLGMFSAIRRARGRYFDHYINVKKGGIGGISIMLVGYVALSYIWQFERLKEERWRKYH